MDLRKLKTLIDLVQNSGISELEISEGEEKIRIAKHSTAASATTYVNMPAAGSRYAGCRTRCSGAGAGPGR
jgi:acetyl-CoA carboxylase biotin carboxyl carrier protein